MAHSPLLPFPFLSKPLQFKMVSPNPTSWEILDPISARPSSELYKANTISEDMSGNLSSEDQPNSTHNQEYTGSYTPGIAYIPNPETQEDNGNNQDFPFSLMLQERQNKLRLRQSGLNKVHAEPEQVQQNFPLPPSHDPAVLAYQLQGRPNMGGPPIAGSSFPPVPVYDPLTYNTPAMPAVAPRPGRQEQNSEIDRAPHYMQGPARVASYTPYQVSSVSSSQTIWPQDRNTPSSQKTISLSEANGLRAQITYLQEKVLKLEGKPVDPVASKYQVLYRIEKDDTFRGIHRGWDRDEDFRSPWMGTFTDPPEVIHSSMGSPHLRCNDRLTNFELYLALNKDISFVVFRNFKRRVERQSSNARYGKPEPFSETILPVSEDLKDVFEEMLSGREFSSMYRGYQSSREVTTPYLFVYHNRSKMTDMRHGLSSVAQRQLDLFMGYVQETCGEEYAAADTLLNNGRIRPEYIQYLFKPNEVLVSNNNNEYTGYIAVDWPLQDEGYLGFSSWTVSGQTWDFDGSFCRRWGTLEFQTPEPQNAIKKRRYQRWTPNDDPIVQSFDQEATEDSSSAQSNSDKEYAITDLAVFPIKYASNELVQMLRRRGEIFWKLRTHRYVSYHATEEENFQTMVCIQTVFQIITIGKPELINATRPMTDT